MTDELPDRSHNLPPDIAMLPVLPPEPTGEAVAEAMAAAPIAAEPPPYDAAKFAAFVLRVSAFTEACGKWRDIKTISTAEQSEKLTDFIGGARGIAKQIEEQRKADKGVWDDKGKIVQAAYVLLIDKMTRAVESVKPLQADWLKREQARIDAEKAELARLAAEKKAEAERLAAQAAARNDVDGEVEAERLRKEAAKDEKSAARTTRAKAGSASGGGRSMSMRSVKTAEIHSRNSIYMHFRDHPAVIDLLQRLANEAVRAGVEFDPKILTVRDDQVAA